MPRQSPFVIAVVGLLGAASLGLLGAGATSCATGPDERQVKLKEGDFHYKLASGFYSEGEVNKALGELMSAVEKAPDHALAHHLMAVVRIARREFYEALKHASRAVELAPKLHEAKNNLGVVYLALSRWEDAVKVYEALVREPRYTTPYMAHNNLGWALWKLNRRDEAHRQFKKAVFFNPKFCLAFNNLGLSYLEEGRFDDAEKQLRKALSVDPSCDKSYAEPHLHLARLYERQSRAIDACAQLRICIDKAPPGEEQASSGGGHSPVGMRCERKAEQLDCPPPSPEERSKASNSGANR